MPDSLNLDDGLNDINSAFSSSEEGGNSKHALMETESDDVEHDSFDDVDII